MLTCLLSQGILTSLSATVPEAVNSVFELRLVEQPDEAHVQRFAAPVLYVPLRRLQDVAASHPKQSFARLIQVMPFRLAFSLHSAVCYLTHICATASICVRHMVASAAQSIATVKSRSCNASYSEPVLLGVSLGKMPLPFLYDSACFC